MRKSEEKRIFSCFRFCFWYIYVSIAGINFEDQIIGGEGIYSIDEQCLRIKAIREVSEEIGAPIFINARTDIFLKASNSQRDHYVKEAINRSLAYKEAGANGFFVPGLSEDREIEQLCQLSPLPINVMISLEAPNRVAELAKLGVSRVSYGPSPYGLVMDTLKRVGLAILN